MYGPITINHYIGLLDKIPSAAGIPKLITKKGLTGAASSAEAETGIVLPDNCMVLDCFIKVTTAVTGKTIDIGTDGDGSNDPDGFADGLSVAATGYVRPQAAITEGVTETYFSANTRGELLSDYVAGDNTATDHGLYREKPDFSSGGEKVTYTPQAATAALVFDLFLIIVELP